MKKRPLIGVIAPIISKEYIGSIICGIINQAKECKCDVIILSPLVNFNLNVIEQTETEKYIFDLILSEDFDGFLYIRDGSTMGNEVVELVERLLEKSNKYVMAVDEKESAVFDSTQYDDYYDFSKVVEHLVQVHKYKKIYCLTGPEHLFQSQSRLRAYTDIMDKYGLYYDETYYFYGTFWIDSSKELARRLTEGELEMPEAIVCGNDIVAMSLIKCLQGAGIRVPEDVAVTGYDGFPFAANIDITLTTYLRNNFQLGADAMRRLFRNITGKLCRKVSRPDSGFIIGSSCGCKNIPAHQMKSRIAGSKPKMWLEETFCDNLIYDLSQAEDIDSLLSKALSHAYMLYLAETVNIYLSDNWMNGDFNDSALLSLRASFSDDRADIRDNGRRFCKTDISSFIDRNDEKNSAIFLSPLHYGSEHYGYIALSFSDTYSVYDVNYLNFVSCLNINLHRLMKLSDSCYKTEKAENVRKARNLQRYKDLCALRKQLEDSPEKYPNIESICAEVNISRSALQKNYKAFFGTSIFEELILFRVEKAKKLLLETNLPVNEISELCGYSSESYFMKQFKKITEMTPTEYRVKKSED